jgi:hypothetical protein
MFEHNLRLTYRTFLRSKGSFFINLVGLSAGLTCALLICLWVRDELKVDAFFANDDRLVQVLQNLSGPQGTETMPATPGPLAPSLAAERPEVAHAVTVVPTLYNSSKGIASAGPDRFKATCQYATPDFFACFPTTPRRPAGPGTGRQARGGGLAGPGPEAVWHHRRRDRPGLPLAGNGH